MECKQNKAEEANLLTPELSLKTQASSSSVNCPLRTLLMKSVSTAFLLELMECKMNRTTMSTALWAPASVTPSMVCGTS